MPLPPEPVGRIGRFTPTARAGLGLVYVLLGGCARKGRMPAKGPGSSSRLIQAPLEAWYTYTAYQVSQICLTCPAS
jgi:hypothetical protein